MNIREINVMHVIITILKYVIKMVRKTSTLFQINLLGERLYESNFVLKFPLSEEYTGSSNKSEDSFKVINAFINIFQAFLLANN